MSELKCEFKSIWLQSLCLFTFSLSTAASRDENAYKAPIYEYTSSYVRFCMCVC